MAAGDTRHTKRKQDNNLAEISLIKNPKIVPSILKGVAAPRKPRVGDDFQAEILPCPPQRETLESPPKTQPRSELAAPPRPSSATTTTATEEQISQPQLHQQHECRNKHGAASISGQIRLCTKSLFFEPDDVRIPIVRLPFQFLEQLEGLGKQQLAAVALRWYKMKANAADEPYIFEKGRSSSWNFKLIYAALADFMPLAQRMLVASRLPLTDQEALLDDVLAEVEGSLRFDPGHLRSPSTETIVLEIPAMRLAPLLQEPCRLAITNTRLYLQPLHNISGDAAVLSHPLAGIAAVARRRSSLKDIGLEVDRVVEDLTAQASLGDALPGGRSTAAACGSVLEAGGGWLQRVTAAWQHGLISNFDYLLYCNLAAGRSFNDLTQYPVFPWVIQDYSSTSLNLHDPGTFRDLSRPIGALNPTRLAQFQERYREMASDSGGYPEGIDPPFLYGTHYSCPGYTMFWLVRAAPAHMLRLQNGKFDAPDRLFCSISEAWDSVLTNQADVKELIPEFYMPEQPNFLLNSKRLALGVRQNGRLVGDVELPPWAKNSVDRFLTLHRAALEAPFVSANLHHWIDLIFGNKQRGHAAVEADNVFRHLTYEGAIDPESITDPVQRAATEVAINEFGQCPGQIFKLPHPSRLVCPDIPESFEVNGKESAVATSPTFSSPRYSHGSTSSAGAGRSTTNTSHSLSLGLVSAIIATLEDERQPHPREVPALLRELDVLAKRREQIERQREQEEGKRKEGERKNDSIISSQAPILTTQQSGTSTTSVSVSDSSAPASPFASAKAGLAGKWSAFKDALGSRRESLDKVSSIRSSKEIRYSSSGQLLQRCDESSLLATTASTKNVGHDEDEPLIVAPPAPPEQSPAVLWKTASSPSSQKQKEEEEEDKEEDTEDSGGSWGPGFRDRLSLGRSFVAGSEGVNAIDLAVSEGKTCAYTASHDGSIRIFDAETGVQLRAANVGAGQPLTSLALLNPTSSSSSNFSTSSSSSQQKHPTVLCGSYDGNVYAYNPSAGIIQGQFTPHTDAVSCIALSSSASSFTTSGMDFLVTSSWDCSVKLWSLEQGRQPWDSTLPQPVSEVGDLPGGVWALALALDSFANPSSSSSSSSSAKAGVLVGTEEGFVVYIDVRLPGVSKIAWQKEVSQDYIGGVSFLPNGGLGNTTGSYALAACADGTFALLDTRRGGDIVSTVNCGTSLRCCATDGIVSVAGGEYGAVHFWDVSQQSGRSLPAGALSHSAPGIDGLYPPLSTSPASPVSSLAVKTVFRKQSGGAGGEAAVCLATGHEGGVVHIYWASNSVE
ncbi:hypothetical protein Ndes2437A_g01474 [Nannochloris sp. 'desiccata']